MSSLFDLQCSGVLWLFNYEKLTAAKIIPFHYRPVSLRQDYNSNPFGHAGHKVRG